MSCPVTHRQIYDTQHHGLIQALTVSERVWPSTPAFYGRALMKIVIELLDASFMRMALNSAWLHITWY